MAVSYSVGQPTRLRTSGCSFHTLPKPFTGIVLHGGFGVGVPFTGVAVAVAVGVPLCGVGVADSTAVALGSIGCVGVGLGATGVSVGGTDLFVGDGLGVVVVVGLGG